MSEMPAVWGPTVQGLGAGDDNLWPSFQRVSQRSHKMEVEYGMNGLAC